MDNLRGPYLDSITRPSRAVRSQPLATLRPIVRHGAFAVSLCTPPMALSLLFFSKRKNEFRDVSTHPPQLLPHPRSASGVAFSSDVSAHPPRPPLLPRPPRSAGAEFRSTPRLASPLATNSWRGCGISRRIGRVRSPNKNGLNRASVLCVVRSASPSTLPTWLNFALNRHQMMESLAENAVKGICI
jgi:hypothetical protein